MFFLLFFMWFEIELIDAASVSISPQAARPSVFQDPSAFRHTVARVVALAREPFSTARYSSLVHPPSFFYGLGRIEKQKSPQRETTHFRICDPGLHNRLSKRAFR
jgi:hypothetical protein